MDSSSTTCRNKPSTITAAKTAYLKLKASKTTSRIRRISLHSTKVNTKKETFEKAVEKAKEYVTAGDIFQVVLSKRYQLQIKGSLIPFYQALRNINPSPYMYFYKSGDQANRRFQPRNACPSGQQNG